MLTAQYCSTFPVPATDLYAWHDRVGALERLTPPWQSVKVVESPEKLKDGARAVLEIRQGPVKKRWVAEHFDVERGVLFRDRQAEGPLSAWTHSHHCETRSDGESVLRDEIRYELPLAPLSERFGAGFARKQLDRLFFYRHAIMQNDIRRFRADRPGSGKTVLVTGHTGIIGQALLPLLRMLGFNVRGLTRRPRERYEFHWDYEQKEVDPAALDSVDAVVHLAGENIAGGRWTEARRKRILESRREGTGLIARTMADLSPRPAVLISASGVNFYAEDGSAKTESSKRGNSFLSEVCAAWEAAADPARAAGIRVVHARCGVVLTPQGGALSKMLPAFLAGAGGPIGSGNQHFPWTSIEDVLGVIVEALLNEQVDGPLNVCSPEPVTQREFARTLGRVVRRPTIFRLPATVVKTAFGQMGEEALLADLNVVPERLQSMGYDWRYRRLEDALRVVLGRPLPWQVPDVELPTRE